jgi:hypothetical protein
VADIPPEIFEEVMAFSAITAFDVFFNSIAFTFATLLRALKGVLFWR